MSEAPESPIQASSMRSVSSIHFQPRERRCLWALLALTLCFSWPLYELGRFSLGSELFSHVLLIPLVSAYFYWQNRGQTIDDSRPNYTLAVILSLLGLLGIGSYVISRLSGQALARVDALAWQITSFVLLAVGTCGFFLGRQTIRKNAFPLAFLVFLAPLPLFVTEGIEHFLQHASASAASIFFQLAGMSMYRSGTYFQLPGISLNVAPECSGIRSTMALFLVSLVAGYLFLRSPRKRIILAAAVLPLAIIRNGFRVFVIGELCVRVGPHMIDSYIHHQGGPIFFALSLIPFSALLWWLTARGRRERRAS